MAKKTLSKPAAFRPALSKPEPLSAPSGFYDARLVRFLAQSATLPVICLEAAASWRIGSTYSALSPAEDNPGHFAGGRLSSCPLLKMPPESSVASPPRMEPG